MADLAINADPTMQDPLLDFAASHEEGERHE